MLHELLSNPSWIDPQINYLLWLQGLRIQTGGIFDKFFLSLTTAGELFLPTVAMCIIYWCFDSKAGVFLFMLNGMSNMINQLLKMIACVYRPWVLSNEIHPQEQAIRMAGGYSFPSGHSTMAASSWGGMAFLGRKNILLCVMLSAFVLLIGFSRNFLGVHTPQDVVIGILIGVVMIFVVHFLIDWCEKDKNRYLCVLFLIDIVFMSLLYFILTKNYPMDYLNGKLLVNPLRGQHIAVIYYGWMFGLINGAILCRRFFPFNANEACINARIARGVIGFILLGVMFYFVQNYLFDGIIKQYRITFICTFLVGFFVTAIYPFIFLNLPVLNVFKKLHLKN